MDLATAKAKLEKAHQAYADHAELWLKLQHEVNSAYQVAMALHKKLNIELKPEWQPRILTLWEAKLDQLTEELNIAFIACKAIPLEPVKPFLSMGQGKFGQVTKCIARANQMETHSSAVSRQRPRTFKPKVVSAIRMLFKISTIQFTSGFGGDLQQARLRMHKCWSSSRALSPSLRPTPQANPPSMKALKECFQISINAIHNCRMVWLKLSPQDQKSQLINTARELYKLKLAKDKAFSRLEKAMNIKNANPANASVIPEVTSQLCPIFSPDGQTLQQQALQISPQDQLQRQQPIMHSRKQQVCQLLLHHVRPPDGPKSQQQQPHQEQQLQPLKLLSHLIRPPDNQLHQEQATQQQQLRQLLLHQLRPPDGQIQQQRPQQTQGLPKVCHHVRPPDRHQQQQQPLQGQLNDSCHPCPVPRAK